LPNLQAKIIVDAFSIIGANEISGWEVWLQIEFARFLSGHHTEPTWWRESKLEFDYRKEKEKYFFKPDFLIRKKGWHSDGYAALEIKQHRNAAICVSNMINDLVKVSKVRKSELNLRCYWALGFFMTDPADDVEEIVLLKGILANVEVTESQLAIEEIEGTHFSYALF
jgi:hypothetical protein